MFEATTRPGCRNRLGAALLASLLALAFWLSGSAGVCLGAAKAGGQKGELVFGMSAALSGPARGLGVEYYRGLLAALNHANEGGGIDGRRLALTLRDDGYDPAAALSNTITFVEEERVFALLGYVGTPTTARVLPLLKRYRSTGVVLLFPLTGADMLREPPHTDCVFNLRASYLDETRNLVAALLAAGKKRIAVFHQADVYGRNGWDGVRRTLREKDLAIVSEAAYRRGARFAQDFRREVGIIQAGKPDAIVTVGTAPACAAFVRDLRNAGGTALVAALSFADSDNVVRYLKAQERLSGRDYATGLIFSQVVPSYEDTSLPAVRLYRQVMDKADAALPADVAHEDYTPHRYSFVGFEGFVAGLVLTEAVKRAGAEPTRQGLSQALRNLHGLDIGIGEKVDFRPGGNEGLRRTFLTVYRQGRFESVADLAGAAR